MGGGLQGQRSSQPFRRAGSRGGKLRGRGLDLPWGWVTPPRSTSRTSASTVPDSVKAVGTRRTAESRSGTAAPSSGSPGGGVPWTSVFRAGRVSFRLPPGKERDVDGQVPDIADDGFERGFDAFVPSLGFPGDRFDRGFDPLEPLLVPALGAFQNRDDDRRASEDDTRDSDPFLTSHG